MKIVNVIPESFMEYEDHIAIILFCYQCNIRCCYCYNYEFVTDPKNIMKESAKEIIDKHASPLVNGLVFLGGEPTIYGKDLLQLAEYAKKTYNLDNKVFTNGSHPQVIIDGLEQNLFNAVSLDYKCLRDEGIIDTRRAGITFDEYHTRVSSLMRTIYERGWSDKVEIRTTQHSRISDGDILEIEKLCRSYGMKHLLQEDLLSNYQKLKIL
jgi:pyruvate formate lyase activating enzyme